ncbi:nucleolar protein,Nop52-domain-containing protein [Multifurca ochricompacta]|uniref:Nucleolar protein,Nop52-domain-containing protein n=1 Tax=Multifurca ochricompacta TaxID=376703 RepID=A0AAD4MD09_9AGAM|nr:nucleolar protein,Nop52-domain-containing protein [Multifurca ochricompacta]
MASTSASIAPPLGKYLASTDKKTRDNAVKKLAAFLSNPGRPRMSSLEMDKLWKGIFYCFWMSDKPLVQQSLASELANILLDTDNNDTSFEFLEGFWSIIVREWDGIDRLRMDKYYILIRRFVNASFRLLMRSDWNAGLCKVYNDGLTVKGGPLCPDDNRVPSSLKYHVADVYLQELDKVLAWDSGAGDEPPPPAPLDTLIAPFLILLARTPSNHTFERVMSAVLEPLIQSLTHTGSDEPPSKKRRRFLGDEIPFVLGNSHVSTSLMTDRSSLRQSLLKQVFSIASEQETRDSNRRKLYKFWKINLDDDDDDGDDDDGARRKLDSN